MEDSFSNEPRISVRAETARHGHERKAENVPVIQGFETLTGFVRSGAYSTSEAFLIQSEYFTDVAIIAQTLQSALDYAADFGVLDPVRMTEEEAHEVDRVPLRLGNAGEPFDMNEMHHVVSEWSREDIIHFHQEMYFGAEGWMHLYSNNRHRPDEPPFKDLAVRVNKEFEVIDKFVPKGEELGAEPDKIAQEWAEEHIWNVINKNC